MDDLIGSLDKGIHEMKKRANMVNIFAYHINIYDENYYNLSLR